MKFIKDSWNSFLFGFTFGAFGKRYQPEPMESIIKRAELKYGYLDNPNVPDFMP